MADEQLLGAYTLALAAALARDLERAELLSDASRKVIHDGLAHVRGMEDAGGAEASSLRQAALHLLDQIHPAADG